MDEQVSAEAIALSVKPKTISIPADCSEDMYAVRRKLRIDLINLIRAGEAPAQTLPYPSDDAADLLASTLDSDSTTIRTVVAHIRASGDHLDPATTATATTVTPPAATATAITMPSDDGFFYFVYNKPMGAICARFRRDEYVARAAKIAKRAAIFAKAGKIQKVINGQYLSVFDTLPPGYPPVPHVGRLDKDTCGLIMFTDNSSLHQPLLNKVVAKERGAPCISKLYEVDICPEKTMYHKFGCLNLDYVLKSMSEPLEYIDKHSKDAPVIKFTTDPAKVHVVDDLGAWSLSPGAHVRIRVEISEGRNRQVRRLCKRAGAFVVRLMRINFGELQLGDLQIGEARSLTVQEVQNMFDMFSPHYPVLVKRKGWESEFVAAKNVEDRNVGYTLKKMKRVDQTETSMAKHQNEQSDCQNTDNQASASASSSTEEAKPIVPFKVKIATLPHPAFM